MSNNAKIVAIAVTYHPELEKIHSFLEAISIQVSAVVVVDNTPSGAPGLPDLCANFKDVEVITLKENLGIAYAHNKGMEWAQDFGADYVLLMDQDSMPAPDMVQRLQANLVSANKTEYEIAASGPAYEDPRSGIRCYFMVSRYGFPIRYKPQKEIYPQQLVLAGFLIASGTLIRMDVLNKIGGKRSNYFIDHVDTEWCLRARAAGYKLLGSHDALMYHSIGDEVKKVWFFYMRNVAYHAPLRDYYMFRNTILMLGEVKVSFIWRVFLLLRLIQFMAYFLTFAQERSQRLRLMLLGIYHGIRRMSGRLDPSTGICSPIPTTRFDPS